MAKNITLMGADYPNVPAVQLPQTGGGTAMFYDLDDKTSFQLSMPSGWSFNNGTSFKTGNFIYISGLFVASTGVTSQQISLGQIIPEGYRPTSARVDFAAFNNSSDRSLHGIIDTSGNCIFYRPETESMTTIAFTVVYSLQ